MTYASKRVIAKTARDRAKAREPSDLQTLRTNATGPRSPLARAMDMAEKAKALVRATGGKAGSRAAPRKAKTGRVAV